jgi:L-histidine Nalpha-methyltransferase
MRQSAQTANAECKQTEFARDVLSGLRQQPKTLPCRYFYDARGSELFEQITDVPEYYPTTAEIALLDAHAAEIAGFAGPGCCLIEFGSGSSRKTDTLLRALPDLAAYVPIDISGAALTGAVERLEREFPALRVWPVHADFNADVSLPATLRPARRLGFFPGSTIGNFERGDAIVFLRRARALLGANSGFVVGVDLKKDVATLTRAYDDSAGVTAAFNLNLLTRINRELGADFDLGSFAHLAVYNVAAGRIEMHLRSTRPQTVSLAGERFRFKAGETIHTENSHKYTAAEFEALARSAGWEPAQVWTGADGLFSVHYLVPAATGR